jgi:hypothetical protein
MATVSAPAFGLTLVVERDTMQRRYCETSSSLAREFPLPSTLPRRHPLLAQFEERFSVEDQLPPWWAACREAFQQRCPCLESLLQEMTCAEFRRGSVDHTRWKAWRACLCPASSDESETACGYTHRAWNLSLLAENILGEESRERWRDLIVNRGEKGIPHELDLVITSAPDWWLNMSNGRGWTSCMGKDDERSCCIIGNWYDTGVLLAALVERGGDCWTPNAIIARTTLRLAWKADTQNDDFEPTVVYPSSLCVALGRVYHNDQTAAYNLLAELVRHIEQRGLAWGCIAATNTANAVSTGLLGPIAVEQQVVPCAGVAFWRPASVDEPYLDGEACFRERREESSSAILAYPSLSIYPCGGRRSRPLSAAH